MAVRIRLQRCGAKHRPTYRIVAAESTKRRDGRFIEILGFYHPKARGAQKEIEIKLERVDYWIKVGAQATETANSLIKRARRAPSTESQKKPNPTQEKATEELPKETLSTDNETTDESTKPAEAST